MRGLSKLTVLFGIAITLVSLGVSSTAQTPTKVDGYQKVVRQNGSLWCATDCEFDQSEREYFCTYLRFYNDGTVIGVTTSGNPREIKKWFRRPYGDSGRYSIEDNRIVFSRTSSAGTIEYSGKIQGNRMILNVNSKINGYQATETFRWVKPLPRSQRRSRSALK